MRVEIREGGAAPGAGDLPLYCAWRRSGCYMHNNVVEVFQVVARRTRHVAGDSRVYKVTDGPRKKPHRIHKVDGVWRHDMGTPDLFVAYGDTEGEALAALRGQVAAKAARLRHRASLYDAFAATCEK